MNENEGRFVLRVPGNPKYVGVVRLAVSGLASRLQLSYEDVEDIKLAVAEACNRAMAHGCGGEITVECEAMRDSFLLSVSGKGFTPPDDEDLGIFLIRSLMDDVKIDSLNGKGIRLSMKKRYGNGSK